MEGVEGLWKLRQSVTTQVLSKGGGKRKGGREGEGGRGRKERRGKEGEKREELR